MQHHSQSPLHYRLESTFCDSILVVSANATVRYGLTLECEIVMEFGRVKWVIICTILLDSHAMDPCVSLERMLLLNSFASAQ